MGVAGEMKMPDLESFPAKAVAQLVGCLLSIPIALGSITSIKPGMLSQVPHGLRQSVGV